MLLFTFHFPVCPCRGQLSTSGFQAPLTHASHSAESDRPGESPDPGPRPVGAGEPGGRTGAGCRNVQAPVGTDRPLGRPAARDRHDGHRQRAGRPDVDGPLAGVLERTGDRGARSPARRPGCATACARTSSTRCSTRTHGVYPTLSQHAAGFPDAKALRALVTTGPEGFGMQAVDVLDDKMSQRRAADHDGRRPPRRAAVVGTGMGRRQHAG